MSEAPAAPAASDEASTSGDEPLGEAGLKALHSERDARAEAEKRAAALQTQLDEFEAAKLSDLEKAQRAAEAATAQATALQAEVEARDLQILRQAVGGEFGLSPKLVARLQGSTEDELRADAKELAALVPDSSPSPFPKADPSQGVQGTPSGGTTADRFAAAVTKAGF